MISDTYLTREQLKRKHRTDMILYTSAAFVLGFTAAMALFMHHLFKVMP